MFFIAFHRLRNDRVDSVSTPKCTICPHSYPDIVEVFWQNEDDYLVTMDILPANVVLNENHLLLDICFDISYPRSQELPAGNLDGSRIGSGFLGA